ncbi:ribonuclease III [Zhaonella formicivorans]|uniref:ribonuclease III n=1 Tax=Zhaonella formicivorans TaxID=2528593 RepID=UPI0010DF29AC|nr:ribonuclease III [Zhaonella formicivorans]
MDAKRAAELRKLADRCGFQLSKLDALNIALTHPTYVFENKGLNHEHNQRLEFLGDAILGLVVGEYLYLNYPEKPEGELTKMRAAVVCETTLAQVAAQLGIGQNLLLGRGEEITGGRERSSILADAFEAILGAVYLEAGLGQVRDFVIRQLETKIAEVAKGAYRDYKTMLQEVVQKNHEENVSYAILQETGPDHDKRFVAGVIWQGQVVAKGTGRSKKEAEQKAAKAAIEIFGS